MRRFALRVVGIMVALLMLAPSAALAADAVNATFADQNLYDTIVAQLGKLHVAYEADSTDKTIRLAPSEMSRVTRLDLSYGAIKDLTGLEQFGALKWLDLSHNTIKVSTALSGMGDLEYLNLYDNAVRDLSGLSGLTKLEYLNLGDNNERSTTQMTGLDALATLTALTELDFSRNQTPEICAFVSQLTKLERLNLMENKIIDVSGLAGLTGLKVLNLNQNDMSGVAALKSLTELEELDLAYCQLYQADAKYGTDKSGINALFGEDSALLLTKLKKFDLLSGATPGFEKNGAGHAHFETLYQLFKERKLDLSFYYLWSDELNTAPEALQHTDGATKYIAYDDFFPYCDGVHDDYNAVFNAHEYANRFGCEVRATVGDSNAGANKTYHIFNYYRTRDLVGYASVDWQNATIYLHDEHIDDVPARFYNFLFLFPSPLTKTGSAYAKKSSVSNTRVTVNAGKDGGVWQSLMAPNALGKATSNISGLNAEVDKGMADLREKGYSRFFVQVFNADKKQFIRHDAGNIEEGYDQWDGFIVDEQGKIERLNSGKMSATGSMAASGKSSSYVAPDPAPVQWDFEKVTKVVITPIPSEQSHIRNGHFVTVPLVSDAETVRGTGKPSDYRRNLAIRNCANVEIANVTQTLGTAETGWDNNQLTGNYNGFFELQEVADITMHDCSAWARCSITSTYGINLWQVVGVGLTNVCDSNPWEHQLRAAGGRWGLTGCNFTKHILYDQCKVSRIDAHMGYYDLTVRDSTLGLGGFTLTGAGPLTIERTHVYSRTFITLRGDYGSTWNGDAHIIDCTHHALMVGSGQEPHNLVAVMPTFTDSTQATPWDFGYDLHHPNLYVKNFTLDDTYSTNWTTNYAMTYGIISNYLNGLEKDIKTDYWPDKVQIDGFDMVNYETPWGYQRHLRFPLKTYGAAWDKFKLKGYSLSGLTYNGQTFSADITQGTDLLLHENISGQSLPYSNPVAYPYDLKQGIPAWAELTLEDIGDRDIVIQYEGDEPEIAYKDSYHNFTPDARYVFLFPYYVEHLPDGSHLAYFSNQEIKVKEAARQANWPEQYPPAQYPNMELLPLKYLMIRTARLTKDHTNEPLTTGVCKLLHVRLLTTHDTPHKHSWDEWSAWWEPTCTTMGRKIRTCSDNGAHAQVEDIPALGHTWGQPSYAWDLDDTVVTATRSCTRISTHTETETVAVQREVVRASTATRKGEARLTATFAGEGFSTQSKTVELPLDPSVIEDVQVTFADQNLYNTLVAQLDTQGVGHTDDEATKTVSISATEAVKVTELDLGFEAISNLTGIEGLAALPNLTKLDLSHNSLTGNAGEPLAALTKLTYLDLYQNTIDDWTFLGSLTKLEHLNLAFNKRGGDTREVLRQLKSLKWLDFSWVGPTSEDKTAANPTGTYNYIIDIVSELTNLEYLDLSNWLFNSLSGIGSLTKLKTFVANYNYIQDLSPLATCDALEELHVAYNRLDWGKNPGVSSIFASDGALILPSLKKLDLWGQESRTSLINVLFDATSDGHRSVNKLYQLHKQKKLCLGYDYRWIDELVAMEPHVDSKGVAYIAYDDFGTFCTEGYDDWNAMRNAHAYANEHGCEVRAVAGEGPTAAQDKTYHIYGLYYNYYHQVQCPVYTSVDWQGAAIYVHDEDLDWHDRANEPLFTMQPSPAGFTDADKRVADNTRTFEVSPATGEPTLTINSAKLPLVRGVASIKGLSPQIDAAIAELNELGYARYYVQLFDATTLRYGRGYNYDRPGNPQWDALIVDTDGKVVRQNAAKLAFDEARDYIPADPEPLQWQFDQVTKVVIAPIAEKQAHIRNARFITMPFNSKRQLPKSRWSNDYTRCLEITGTNLEVAGITQTVGTAEGGYDNDNYSGLYVGFIDLKDCAELSVHDCYTWQRVSTRSTYGINTTRICQAHFKNVGDSNPVYRAGHGNHGGNYAKHMLWENITLGRIDQHTGCYDMCVRDTDVHNLALTGAGPLTVERTTVTGGSFFNFRADYGSTWDGVAHVIDCTHYPILGSTGEPDCFAATTPDMRKQDFGHPRRFPELHVKDFTIDCSKYHRNNGTRYRITYGLIANHVNGLNLLENYWPDVVEVDGLNVRNWRDTMGYELHTLLPLYMQGKPAVQSRAGAWTLKNVRYDGVPFVPVSDATLEAGEDLFEVGELVAGIEGVRDRKLFTKALTTEQRMLLEECLEDSDIVVTYTGDEPRVLLRASGHDFPNSDASWTSAYPYLVEHRGNVEVAYFSGREYLTRRSWISANYPDSDVGVFSTIGIYPERIAGSNGEAGQDGVTNVLHVQLVKTRQDHTHTWGDPTYTWSEDNASCTATRICTDDATHVESEVAEASSQVTRTPTYALEGEITYTATFENEAFSEQVKTISLDKLAPARPESVTGATAPQDEATRDKIYVEDYYGRDYAHYYGPADNMPTDDGTVIEAAMADAAGKTLVFKPGKTYTFGSYVRSNAGGNRWRKQGIHLTTSDVVIEGNGATLLWDESQVFVGNDGLVLDGTMEQPIKNIVIRNLNFKAVNCSRNFDDPLTGNTFKNNNLVQLKGLCCENVLVENCRFEALPHPDDALHQLSDEEGRGITNIWFYGGAQDITVRNCVMCDVTRGSQESGSNLLFSGECEWLRNTSVDFQLAYAAMTPTEQYQVICEQHLQGSVENILIEQNHFEHACHDESLSLWCAEIFKDVLIQGNTFNVHDKDAHVPSTVNVTVGLPAHHDRLDNIIFTDNDVFAQASWDLMAVRADMGGDMHVTNNKLHFDRVKLDRQRVPKDGVYEFTTKEDIAVTNGIIYAALNKDYVDVSGNSVTYDNSDNGKGLMNLMGSKNLICENNRFVANGPLSYLACIFAADAPAAAGHESVFINNSFDINGPLDKALLRGSMRFTDNVVRMNGTMTGSALFSLAGNIENVTRSKINRLYTLSEDLDLSGNKVFMKTSMPTGLAALSIYDASFAGHTLDFGDNELWSTVDQEEGTRPLVLVQDVQGQTPTVDATETASNLFNQLAFYRTSEGDAGYDDYGASLTGPVVQLGNTQFGETNHHWTRHSLTTQTYAGNDPDANAPQTVCEAEGHSWGEPTYVWSDDASFCTARRVCSHDAHHVEEETAEASSQIRAATYAREGETTYTASFENEAFSQQVKTTAQPTLEAPPANATIKSKGLFEAIVDQLQADDIPYTADAAVQTVSLTSEANARFTKLVANHRHIQDIDGLEAFCCLSWIDLSNNLVKTSSQFAGMVDLTYLDLYDNAVRDLSGLENHIYLEHLNLGDNNERNTVAYEQMNLGALNTLTSLKWLDFSRNKTPEVTGHIKDLTTLEYLDLVDNDLKDVYDLAGLTNMRVLVLSQNNGIAGVSSLKDMTELEELHLAFTRLNMRDSSFGTDTSGINGLFNEDGSFKLTKLKKLDLLCDWDTGFTTEGTNAGKELNLENNAHIQELYRMFKAGELEEFGYFYTWFDRKDDPQAKRTPDYMHTDPVTGVKYISYEDFDPYCDGVRDDYYAIFNAHEYANTYGCEVRATIKDEDAPTKTFHIFKYHNWRDLIAHTNIDWQGANFVIHDENIDHYPSRHFAFLLLYTGPTGSTVRTAPADRRITIDNPTINEGKSLGTGSTSIAGLSNQVDDAIAELHSQYGYERFYVMATNENKRQYRRHEGLDYRVNWDGRAQWDGFIVGTDGTIETPNASRMLPFGQTALSSADYHSPTPGPVQWDFDDITRIEIIPIPAVQSYVKNANFVTMPLEANGETPRDGGGKPTDYRRCLDFRYCTNLEIANIDQQLGYAETGYDHEELSGSYYGFFTINHSADLEMHDCTAWDRVTKTSSYGIQLYQIVNARFTRVSASNPTERYLTGADGSRWGLTGDDYGKHLLFDHCTLGRIDAHMGFYDVAIRDCQLGTGGLCLTGQGPLTVERTVAHSGTFLNLRADYGSTWNGDAHINDCTHYWRREVDSPEPGGFTCSSPRFTTYAASAETVHDFGYPVRHPNLYVRNFTLDNRYFTGSTTEYSSTYGVVNNWTNGLMYYKNYWPEVVDIDGFHVKNYEDSLGYERHVHIPLKMYGSILDDGLLKNYHIKNVTYDGEPLTADLSIGEELHEMPYDLCVGNASRDTVLINKKITTDEIGDKDIVIEYTGDEPDLAFTDSSEYYWSDDHWIVVKPYFIEHRWNEDRTAYTEVAYFSSAEIRHRWERQKEECRGKVDAQGKPIVLNPIVRMNIRATVLFANTDGTQFALTNGDTHLLHVKLLDTHEHCDHVWGEWQLTKAPSCEEPGEEQRVCSLDETHVESREVAALGHEWGKATYTWSEDNATCTATLSCARNPLHVKSETVATTSEVTKAAGPNTPGELTYTAAFTMADFETQIKRVEIEAQPVIELTYDGYAGAYDGMSHAPVATVNLANATITYSSDGGKTWSVTPPSITKVGTVSVLVRASYAGIDSVELSATLTVVPKAVELEWTGTTLTYSGQVQAPTATIAGVLSGDDARVVVVGAHSNVGDAYTATAVLAGSDADNYALPTMASVSYRIEPAATLTVDVEAYEGSYDGIAHAIVATPSVASGTVLSFTTKNPRDPSFDPNTDWNQVAPQLTDAGSLTVWVRATNPNYIDAHGSATLVIRRKAVVVKADNLSKVYGTTDPTFTASVSGLLGEDELAYMLMREPGESVGTYAIMASGNELQGNYHVTFVAGSLAITRGDAMVVNATGWEGVYDGQDHAVSALATVDDAAITYSLVDPAQAIESDWNAVAPTIKDVGTKDVWVRAVHGGFETAYDHVFLTVTPKDAVVTAHSVSKTYGTPNPVFTATVLGLVGTDTLTYTLSCDDNQSVGEHTITPTGEERQGNYLVTYVSGTLAVAPATPQVGIVTVRGDVTDAMTAAAITLLRSDMSSPGTLALDSTTLVAGQGEYAWTFTPTDARNYHVVTGMVELVVGHAWGEVAYSWNDDAHSCIATRVCTHCGERESESANVTSKLTRAASCEETGETSYYADFENPAFASQITTRADIAALGHEWGEVTYAWTQNMTWCTAFRHCRVDPEHVEAETATIEDATVTSEITREPDYTQDGERTYTARFANPAFKISTTTVAIPMLISQQVFVSGISALNKEYDGSCLATLDTSHAVFSLEDGGSPVDALTVTATGMFSDKNAGTEKEVVITELELVDSFAGKYQLASDGQQKSTRASILPKVIGLSWQHTEFEYDGEAHAPLAIATGLLADEICNVTVSGAQTNVGEGFVALATELSNHNYALPEEGRSCLFSIKAKQSSAFSISIDDWTYGEEPHAPQIIGASGDLIIEYKLRDAKDETYVRSVPVDAGDYTVRARQLMPVGIEEQSTTANFSIIKATIDPAINSKSWSGWTYGEDASLPEVNGNIGNGTLIFEYRFPPQLNPLALTETNSDSAPAVGADSNSISSHIQGNLLGETPGESTLPHGSASVSAVSSAPSNASGWTTEPPRCAGRYEIRAIIGETANYCGAATEPLAFEIRPARVLVTADDKASSFGETMQELTYTIGAGVVLGDKLDLVVSSDVSHTSPVGTYDITVSWADKADPNYDITFVPGVYTVLTGKIDMTALGWSGTYDGSAHSIAVVSSTPGVTVRYSATTILTAENYLLVGQESAPVRTDAGTTTVYYYLASDNHEGVSGSKDISIAKAPLKVRASDAYLTYGEHAPNALAVSYEGLIDADLSHSDGVSPEQGVFEGSLSFDWHGYTAGSPVGNYPITAGGLIARNYDISYLDGSLMVSPRTANIVWEGDSFEYTGTERSVLATISNRFADDDVSLVIEGSRSAVRAGSYDVVASGLSGEAAINYRLPTDTSECLHTWEIKKARNAATVFIDGWSFGQTAQIPRVEASFGVETALLTWGDDLNGSFSDRVPTDAGTHYVRVTIPDTQDYASATATTQFVIAKALPEVTISVDGWIEGNYSPLANAPRLKGNVSVDELSLSWRARDSVDDWHPWENMNAIVAGSYVLRATSQETANRLPVTATTFFDVVPSRAHVEVTTEQRSPSNWGRATILATSDLVDALGVNQGEEAEVWVVVDDIQNKTEVATITSAAQGYTIACILDLRLYMAMNGIVNELHELTRSITVTLELPSDVRAGISGAKTLVVLRTHGGRVDYLDTDYDAQTGRLSFQTDRFSSYAVAYQETPIPASPAVAAVNQGANSDSHMQASDSPSKASSTSDGHLARTSDLYERRYVVYIALLGMILLSLGLLMADQYRKRIGIRKRQKH